MTPKPILLTALLLAAVACSNDAESGDATPVGSVDSLPAATATGSTPAATAADPEPEPPTTETEPSDAVPDTISGSTTTVSDQPPQPVEALYDDGDIDRGLQPFIDQARDDLADRLGVASDEITVHSAVLVIWPDSSLGCPQPGMSYTQANEDGSVIELLHDGDVYRYHTGGLRGPFICEQPTDKLPPPEKISLDD